MEPVHQFSNRAGFFDLAGCTITDILPRYVIIISTCIFHIVIVVTGYSFTRQRNDGRLQNAC